MPSARNCHKSKCTMSKPKNKVLYRYSDHDRISRPPILLRRFLRGPLTLKVFVTVQLALTAALILAYLDPIFKRPVTSHFVVINKSIPSRYTYVFYAANDNYCCAAMVNMARLRGFTGEHVLANNVDLVLRSRRACNASPRSDIKH